MKPKPIVALKEGEDLDEIAEYKSGKILYEEVLTGLLQQANTSFVRNDFVEFCFTVQSIWNNLYERDRVDILKAVELQERIDKDAQYRKPEDVPLLHAVTVLSLNKFNTMMLCNLNSKIENVHLLEPFWAGKEWRRAYQLLQETLREKYHGNYKRFTKDKLPKGDKTMLDG